MNEEWLPLALAAALAAHLAAAISLVGFVPERLPFRRVLLAEVAGAYVKLAIPSGIGNLAFTVRFLTKGGGLPLVPAVASVALAQSVASGWRMLLLVACGSAGGVYRQWNDLWLVLLAAALMALVVAAVAPARRWLVARARPTLAGAVARLRELGGQPGKPAAGITGSLLLSVALGACFDACLLAFGARPGIAALTVAFLTGHAVGSAVPTPGGIGAVEAALIGALVSLAHVPVAMATPAVLLYRILVFWLPALPGCVCFSILRRKHLV